jgi:hypothetical protein
MARTTTEVLARARAAIADADAARATDATCLGYVVDGLNIIKSARPDLFLGAFGTTIESIAIDTAIPISGQFFLALAMFVGAMIEHQDDESADHARGELLTRIAGGTL